MTPKQTSVCIFIVCVFCVSILNTVLGQGIPLAQRVFQKHKRTLQRADIQEILPQVLEGLKAPDNQRFLNPRTINLIVDNPDFLPIFIPDIEPKFVALLKSDWELKNLLRDPLVQRLLQSPAAIDELARLLEVGGGAGRNLPDLPAQTIYDQAISSVVWIATLGSNKLGKGSGVLIDKARRLVVTNEHVVRGIEMMSVFFPYKDGNGALINDEGFYFDKWEALDRIGYHTDGRIIARNRRNDLAIIQLNSLPRTAREIKHDLSRNVENSMKKGDTVHILGNPGIQLWDWDRGVFVSAWRDCLPSGGDCLEMEAGVRGGNSGGPVLNGQGTLIGIVAATNNKTQSTAVPARNVRALLATVPAHLPVPPKVFPKRTFKIKNPTGFPVPYQIKWSPNNNWQPQSLRTGFIRTHRSNGQNIPTGYPKIRFDYIAGDQWVTYRVYKLESAGKNANVAPTYRFAYNQRGDRLDLYQDGFAAPTLSREVPKETALLSNYPNPFNPETWIPYQLAEPAAVRITIYAADGALVRTLKLGHQPAGVYQDKSRAAYWDGKNELGEPVASGVYFYTLTAGEFTATRKMLIRK